MNYFKHLTKDEIVPLVMSYFWLTLLIPSIVFIFCSDLEMHQRVLGLLGEASFIAIYVYLFAKAIIFKAEMKVRSGVAVGVILALIAMSLYPIIGWQAFIYLNFVLPVWNFRVPLRLAMWLGGVLIAAATIFLIWLGETSWGYIFSAIGVFVITAGTRFLEDVGDRQIQLQARLAVLEERDRMARDIHDLLGHSLTVITLKSELTSRLLEKDPAAARAELAQISTLSREAIAEVRATVAGLRERSLDQELNDAQVALQQSGIAVKVINDGVSTRFEQLFAWIVRECVTNIIRYSDASKVTIEISECALQINDNGRGFPDFCDNVRSDVTPPHAERNPSVSAGDAGTLRSAAGNGLRGILERVTLAGGHVHFYNDPGATVTVEMMAHALPNRGLD
ncbi:histidine kinase [Arcanobacterium canis]|uniref:Histidine kinase n=1 Tax=Arcanobacterium canis TaxID=999183 RepID=A0ABY8FWY1_9ACTO|nr:histidine kinase [Arcanobacterium canis]WFM83014.1 histidine kinase [Arcanobacterium canis]